MIDIFKDEKMLCANRIKEGLKIRNIKQSDLCSLTGIPKSAMSQYISGNFKPKQDRIYLISNALNVSEAWLMGFDVPMERTKPTAKSNNILKYPSPDITEDYTTFRVIGEIAAGYDNPAYENWDGENIEIPNSYLKGRNKEEFFVLKVRGDSMFPMYQDGDYVLILKQTTLNHSGDIGAVLYDDEYGTLKKVEYIPGEDWMKLIPINPNYKPELIEGERLEHCRIIGIPKLLIREI